MCSTSGKRLSINDNKEPLATKKNEKKRKKKNPHTHNKNIYTFANEQCQSVKMNECIEDEEAKYAVLKHKTNVI